MNETPCDRAVGRHQPLEGVRETTLSLAWETSPIPDRRGPRRPVTVSEGAHHTVTMRTPLPTTELLMGSALRTTRAKLLTSTARRR